MCPRIRTALLWIILVCVAAPLPAQVTAGRAEGSLQDAAGNPAHVATIVITGGAGFRTTVHTDADGHFTFVAAYGRYRLSPESAQQPDSSAVEIYLAPLQVTHIDVKIGAAGAFELVKLQAEGVPGMWSDTSPGLAFPEGFSLQSTLLDREPQSDTQPLDLNGLADNRLPIVSRGALSWTNTQYKLNGMDATDAYQPGQAAILPNLGALSDIVVRGEFAQLGSDSPGAEVGLFSVDPAPSWHGSLSSSDTGSLVTSKNLRAPNRTGIVQQNDQYIWFTRDSAEAGGPLTKWADLYASAAGQWALQTVPLASLGTNQGSQMLFADVRNRIRLSPHDQLDLLFSGSRVSLSNDAVPANIVDLMSRRMAPSLVLPGGFLNESEADQFNFFQAGWTHQLPADSNLGLLQVRYGYSIAHLDTTPLPGAPQQSSVELMGGAVTGAAPIADLASQTRHQVQGAWLFEPVRLGLTRHQFSLGGGWEGTSPTDRVTTPEDMNLVTVNGSGTFAVEFNTPLVTRETVRSTSLWVTDHITMAHNLSLDLGAFADFSRGSLPAQSSPAGAFAPARTYAAEPDLIAWNSVSPRVGIAWVVPHSHHVLARLGYYRLYAPLAGRDLDFGNPNSLGGSQYQWNDLNGNGVFEPGEQGQLQLHFGGPYSSISPTLQRPYTDKVTIGVEMTLAHWGTASVLLYRGYDNDRLAVIDNGLPAGAFTPVTITDPANNLGPAPIEVFAQNPATFGLDHYLLTNPAGLRLLNEGFVVEMSRTWRNLTFHGSLAPQESRGPTNPGDSVFENDPGIVGNLLMDPNTTPFAVGRSFTDRAWAAKIQLSYRLPPSWGGFELDSTLNYLDGLAFGRELLVTGLPQGPFLVQATRRGWSPQGGYRSEFIFNWNLRLHRDFHLPTGTISGNLDILNVFDSDSNLQESDLTDSQFLLRLPVATQPPRNIRIGIRYDF